MKNLGEKCFSFICNCTGAGFHVSCVRKVSVSRRILCALCNFHLLYHLWITISPLGSANSWPKYLSDQPLPIPANMNKVSGFFKFRTVYRLRKYEQSNGFKKLRGRTFRCSLITFIMTFWMFWMFENFDKKTNYIYYPKITKTPMFGLFLWGEGSLTIDFFAILTHKAFSNHLQTTLDRFCGQK